METLSEKRRELRVGCENPIVIPSGHTRKVLRMLLDDIKKQDKEFIKRILEIGLLGIQRDKIKELAGEDLT